MEQVDECDASRNLNQLVRSHLACEVVLKQHLIPDEDLGTRMPVHTIISFVLDEGAVNAVGELEVEAHSSVPAGVEYFVSLRQGVECVLDELPVEFDVFWLGVTPEEANTSFGVSTVSVQMFLQGQQVITIEFLIRPFKKHLLLEVPWACRPQA